VTGGDWHVYSCNLWDDAASETGSQIAKLNLFAKLANLQPGQRILDIGCGWGGPLVYLCKVFGVSGVGLTLSLAQKQVAEERAARQEVDAEIFASHWKDYESTDEFDLIYSDEVLVHVFDLQQFFQKMRSLLRPNGSMLHKELHLTHPHYATQISRGSSLINEIFGCTGNYRTLSEELALLARAGFETSAVHRIPNFHYQKTIQCWLNNARQHRSQLLELTDKEFFRMFFKYLKIARIFVGSRSISIDIVQSRKCQVISPVGVLDAPP
jgi:cyclopropane-fatty-acyl-phospholipid synthase